MRERPSRSSSLRLFEGLTDVDPEICSNKIRALLRARRLRRRMTQAELALRLGKVQSFVNKIELGDRPLHMSDFLQICKALGANPMNVLRHALR